LFLICAALPLHAADINDLTYDTSGATVTITDCDTAASGALVIPETIEGKPVTRIGDDAFRSCTSLAGGLPGEDMKDFGIERKGMKIGVMFSVIEVSKDLPKE